MSSTTGASLSPSRFHIMKTTIRDYYLRAVIVTNLLKAQKGVPSITARQKAHDRGLSVDTNRARKCPQNQVSVVPLPIIIQDVVDQYSFNGVPLIKAPVPRRPQDTQASVMGASPMLLPRPKAPFPRQHLRPLPLPIPRPIPMDVPMDSEESSDKSASLDSVSLSPMSGCSPTSSSGQSESSGPSTPDEGETRVVLRAKRRSADSSLMDYTFEKRPRHDSNVASTGLRNINRF